jgi:peptidoglycan/xylan/chitin deacetylase (PgdA/CDA1 family)
MRNSNGKGKLTISVDLELAWGVWDWVTAEHLQMAETAERPIAAALIELFDRYEIAATWAIVAALLDEDSAKSRPGRTACWYAPDIVDRLLAAKVKHEIGTHSGRHIYFDTATADEARADLAFARDIHRTHGLPFRSFVYPRGGGGHFDVAYAAGLRTCSFSDVGWVEAVRRLGRRAGQGAHLLDMLLPIPPHPARPEPAGGLVNIRKSMLLMARNGPRRFVLPLVTRAKLRAGLARAQATGGTFHLWFHPSNFYYRRDEQLATLADFLEHAANEAGRGRIEIATMGAYADLSQNPSPSPLAGEGRGGGSGGFGTEVPYLATPTPDPSPHGGGEQSTATRRSPTAGADA